MCNTDLYSVCNTHLYSMSCRMLAAIRTRGARRLLRWNRARLEARRSVVFWVSAAVPAPQQLDHTGFRPGLQLDLL